MNNTLETLGYYIPEEKYEHLPIPQALTKFIAENADPVVTALWLTTPGIYICGGALRAFYSIPYDRDEIIKDFDLYFADKATFDLFLETMKKNGYEPSFESERAITYSSLREDGPPIQAIQYVMGTIEEVLGEFDFTIVKCGASSSEVVMHQNFVDDLGNGALVYCGSKLPLSSLNRAFKYTTKSYWLPAIQMLAILCDIIEKINLNAIEDVMYHLESFDPNAIPEIELKGGVK